MTHDRDFGWRMRSIRNRLGHKTFKNGGLIHELLKGYWEKHFSNIRPTAFDMHFGLVDFQDALRWSKPLK